MLTLNLLYNLLGIVVCSNPLAPKKLRYKYTIRNLCKKFKWKLSHYRMLHDHVIIDSYIQCFFLPLLNMQLMIAEEIIVAHSYLYYGYIFLSLIIAAIYLAGKIRSQKTIFVSIAHSSLLLYLCLEYHPENFWLMYFILLFLINQFAIPRIRKKYDTIPRIELNLISLIFLNIFLINSISVE